MCRHKKNNVHVPCEKQQYKTSIFFRLTHLALNKESHVFRITERNIYNRRLLAIVFKLNNLKNLKTNSEFKMFESNFQSEITATSLSTKTVLGFETDA